MLLAPGSDAANRRARFAVVSRDAPSADVVLDTDYAERSAAAVAAVVQDSRTPDDVGAATNSGKSASHAHLYGVRWSSCESSNGGGVPETRSRPPGHGVSGGPPSTMTSTARRGRYLAVHRYAPQNTSTGSSTSGIDVSMSSSRSELVWGGGGGRRRSAASALAAGCCIGVPVVSSVDADCEDNCDDIVDDALSLYRTSSFRRAIERGAGGWTSPPTPSADTADHHYAAATSRVLQSLTSGARFAVHHQLQDQPVASHRFAAADCSRAADNRELVNPCLSPDDTSSVAAPRAVWDVNVETNSPQDIDPFDCFGLSAELGYSNIFLYF